MTLTPKEYREYMHIHLNLLYFVAIKEKIVPANTNFNKFLERNMQFKFKCREALLDNIELLDEYIASNFDHLTEEEVAVLNGFKRRIRSDFIILKCLTHYAVFTDTNDNKFYAVKALGDPFDIFFDTFPVHVSATLIPFKDKIIYDGFITSSRIYFGKNITASMNEAYKNAKQKKAIVTKFNE